MRTIKKFNSYVPALLLMLGAIPIANAQEPDEPTTTAGDYGEGIEEVVVTGSRIARSDFVAESPIVTATQETLQSLGAVTVDEALSQLPQLAISAGSSANAYNGGAGQAKANLRGLGSQRTMVLIDGRRMVPALPDGSVDLNLLPSNMIDSVEIITGGASAVYGSDAVTGVVNFKLRHDFEGIEVTGQYGLAEEGDATTQDYSVLMGGQFGGDRGSSLISVNYSQRGIAEGHARQFFGPPGGGEGSLPEGVWNVDSTNLPSQVAIDSAFASYGIDQTISPTSRFYFNTDGTLFLQNSSSGPVNYRGPAENIFADGVGYDADTPGGYSQTPLKRLNILGYSDFELSPNFKLFVQGQFADYYVTGQRPPNVSGSSSSFIPTTVPATNPFIPDDLATLLASRPDPTAPITIIKRKPDLIPIYQRWDYAVHEVIGGGMGNLPFRDWTWNAYASASKTTRDERFIDYSSQAAFNQLLAAPDGGQSLCAGGFNPFGIHLFSQSCFDYVNRDTHSITTIEVYSGEATVQGRLFEMPAGEAKFAAGVGYREADYDFNPDSTVSTGELAGFLPVKATNGSTRSLEAFGELLIPLTGETSFLNETNLALAYRYSDHESIGGVSTYKADLDWTPTSMLRLRGGYSRAIRAPSVGELFAPETLDRQGVGAVGPVGSGDACDIRSAYRATSNPDRDEVRALCLAQGMPAPIIDSFTFPDNTNPAQSSGNPDLHEETADTYSVGAVLQTDFASDAFSDISISVDYYSISLEDAIGSITSALAMQRCFNADGSNPSYESSNFYCQLISRSPADGTIALIGNPLFNLGGFETSGIDIGVDWTFPMTVLGLSEAAGELNLRTNVGHLNSFEIQTLEEAPFFDYAGTIGNSQIDEAATARPTWKAFTSINYSVRELDLGLNWRYLGRMDNADNIGTGGTAPATEAVSYFDLNGIYHVSDNIDIRAGIVNLMDRDPPVVNINRAGEASTDGTTYDIIGRRFFVQVKTRF